MRKSIIVLIMICVLFYSGCNGIDDDRSSFASEPEISTSEVSEISSDEMRAVTGLSYSVPKNKWHYLSDNPNVQTYNSMFGIDTLLYVQYSTELYDRPINEETVLDELAYAVEHTEGVTYFEIEESTFQGYRCHYIFRSLDVVQEIDNSYVTYHYYNYSLSFVANGGLYTIVLTSPEELDRYMEDFNEVIDSIVITPI